MSEADERIRNTALDVAKASGLLAQPIEHFLRTGEETWEGAGSGQFTLSQYKEHEDYTRAAKLALRTLFDSLADLLPPEAKTEPPVDSGIIQRRVEPMVNGLLKADWRVIALREIIARTFVLNYPGARPAIHAELTTCAMEGAWRILWALFGDYRLKPAEIKMNCDGLAQDFAHIRWSAFHTKDPYSDVVVHETAHMLHFLKPRHYLLPTRRGQERFVDVDVCHRELFAYSCEAYSRVVVQGERKSRILFAEKMRESAFSFPKSELEEVAALVLDAARARNGWRVIREATVTGYGRRTRGPIR